MRRFLWPFALLLCGCAVLFGWNIHAPGMLSNQFYQSVSPAPARIALYLPPEVLSYRSLNRGGRFADPQTYYIGEALGPMAIEAFQQGFEEFIFLETEPDAALMARYGIAYVAVLHIRNFKNNVTMKGQAVELETETRLYDQSLRPAMTRRQSLASGPEALGLRPAMLFKSTGSSDARKVFSKKGGPEVNLNAAIENNLTTVVQSLQDWLREHPAHL